jgi:hypothetical protein
MQQKLPQNLVLKMSKGLQVEPTSTDRKQIRISVFMKKINFYKVFTTQQDVQGENCDYFINQ